MRIKWQVWESKWWQLLERFKVDTSENGRCQLMFIYDMYNSPTRYYHNLGHLEACLNELEDCVPEESRTPELEMAVWLHDVVYEPQAHDNEERSNLLASVYLFSLGIMSVDSHLKVSKLITATAHRVPGYALEPDERIIRDIDLAWFGHSPLKFERNNLRIRKEYSFVPEETYREKRRELLQMFLNGPHIYYTEPFQSLYEEQARENLESEIAALSQPPTI